MTTAAKYIGLFLLVAFPFAAIAGIFCVAVHPFVAAAKANALADNKIKELGRTEFERVSFDDNGSGRYRAIYQHDGQQIDVYVEHGAVRTLEGEAICRAKPSR